MTSDLDTPELRAKIAKEDYNETHCQIDKCVYFDEGCDRIHRKGGEKIKCWEYKSEI